MNTTIVKVFRLAAVALCVTLDPFITAEVAHSPSQSRSSMYPVVASLDTNNPVCYIQKANGSTMDLSRLCGKQGSGTTLSEIDQKFLDSYNKSFNSYQQVQVLVIPGAEKDPLSAIKKAQDVCSALKSKVPLDKIETDQYEKIIETEDPRNQKIALMESEIIDSLATKFYCPEFAK